MKIKIGRKIIDSITSTRAAGIYLLLFAIAIGVATFIENDFGTSSAQAIVFRSGWFELLLVLFGLTIIMNMWRFKLVKQKKWASLSFHLSIIIILLGAGVTRYFGKEGIMHIREGETSNTYLSSGNYLKFKILEGDKTYSFDEPVYFSSLGRNEFENSYKIGNKLISVQLNQFIPNPTEKIHEDPDGLPTLKIVIGGNNGREEYFVKKGDNTPINGVNFNFTGEQIPGAFNILQQEDSIVFVTDVEVNQRIMATQVSSVLSGGIPHKLMLRSLYTLGNSNFVVGEYVPKAKVGIVGGIKKLTNESSIGLNFNIKVDGQSQDIMISGRGGDEGEPKVLDFGVLKVELNYGARMEKLPFSLKCKDFVMEKYPGTENPSSYASEVELVDQEKSFSKDYRIFMNNILEYRGYRFFQSSFDQDELGTYLSVNHDFWGTWISYIGYIILTIGLFMTFLDNKSRFSHLLDKLKKFHTPIIAAVILSSIVSNNALAQNNENISIEHANAFGRLMVQDHNGRIKPINTFSSELLRKVSRTETLSNQNPDQIILSMMINPSHWENENIIKLPDYPEIKRLLNTEADLLSYSSFFTDEGNYILQDQVRSAQAMMPKNQGVFEKAIIKLDEKVNIVNMILAGSIFRLFPQENDQTNTWITPADLLHTHEGESKNTELSSLLINYLNAVRDGVNTNDFNQADKLLEEISIYQKKNGNGIIPSETKINAELLFNKMDVFNRLRNYYAIICLVLTCVFLYTTIKRKNNKSKLGLYAFYIMLLAFIFHTSGLGLRWYISGRAPWSNGYESMIYIGWTTMLAGILFSRKSLGGLTATATLAATVLLVASMSWLDPEITPLVPVLKSYWLTIHVSLEAGSYGFLMLGAVLGMLNMTLMIFMNEKNKSTILRTIGELTVISEITLLAGLAMISIGTYLGGVWANESWGRYWGWDAKETWALVTILVYAFILHMRFIPGLQGIFAFNLASLFGFATVIMTYLGVNYYLSGLHSYAAGDPVPIPPQVYYTAITLILLSTIAYLKYKKSITK